MSKFKRDDQIALFKKYALELVNAAAQSLHKNEDLMEGGCECISGIDIKENRNPMDVIFLTMSIAKDYKKQLQTMRITSVISEMGINDEFVDKIRSLLAAIQYSSAKIHKVLEVEIMRKYLWRHEQGSSAAGSSSSNNNSIESIKNCYRSMRSLDDEDNMRFTQQLSAGFVIARELMNDDDKDLGYDPRWTRLNRIIGEIYSFSLKPVQIYYSDENFEKTLALLFGN